MSDWNEDNFLERLTPQLRQKSGRAIDPCPDAATLCAVIEGEARQPEQDTVMAHLSQCAACADLRSRLLDFEREGPPEPEAVWNQTRTRLDNWLDGFLHNEVAQSLSPRPGRLSRSFPGWDSISSFFTPRRIVWSMSVALVLVLIVDGVLILEYRQGPLPQVPVAARPAVPPKPPEQGPATPKTGPGEEGLPPAGNKLNARAESPSRPGPGGRGAPPAPVVTPAPGNPNLPGQMTQATPPPAPKPPLPSVRPANNPPAVSAIAAPAGEIHPTLPSVPGGPATPAATRHLPKLWLDPANRLLMVVSSIRFKPDGSFQFRGTLLLPVGQPGAIPLDRGAEVIGVGTINQGQTSLAITELVVQGVRYILKDGTGAMNAQTPGAGGGVDFHRSQVLDMWPVATAVYEKVSNPVEPPGPQK